MKYKLIEAGENEELTQKVKDAISNNYYPIGGVCAVWIPTEEAIWLGQSMVCHSTAEELTGTNPIEKCIDKFQELCGRDIEKEFSVGEILDILEEVKEETQK